MVEEAVETKELYCPVCHKAKSISYAGEGSYSSVCAYCKRLILWDFTNMKASRAQAIKKYNK